MGLFVGYDSPTGRLPTRSPAVVVMAMSWQRCASGLLFFARPAENVVPQVAVVGCQHHQGYGLRGVHDAAASQCDDHVAPVLPCRCRSSAMTVDFKGFASIRSNTTLFDPCQPELFLRGGQIAVCSGRTCRSKSPAAPFFRASAACAGFSVPLRRRERMRVGTPHVGIRALFSWL